MDWVSFCAHAHRVMLAPLVYDRLRRFAGVLPGDVVEWLRHQYYFAVGRNLALLHRLREINAQLARRGVVPLVLKGPGLAHFGVGVNVRLFDDVDILVRRGDVDDVSAVLQEMGYEGPASAAHPYHLRYVGSAGGLVTAVEVHFDLVDQVRRITPDVEGIRARSVAVDVAGCVIRVPAVHDQLLLTAMQLGHHHWAVRLLVDVAFLASRWSHAIDWGDVFRRADAWRMGALARSALYVVSALFGVALPAPVAADVRPEGYIRRVQWSVAMMAALEQFQDGGREVAWLAPYVVVDDAGRIPKLLVQRTLWPEKLDPEGPGALSRGRRLLLVGAVLPAVLRVLWRSLDGHHAPRTTPMAE
ncbi:MAG: nucleotidyltransferase family protein [Armatimonadota bacterium]|nr:nucleotidyltransferase family protein [Armatimonadota bacterium]